MMSTQAKAVLDPVRSLEVIDPKSYGDWDPLLDTFDQLREEMPVAWIEAGNNEHPPFWLISRYDDVMRISKDNATFLNNPRNVVFSLTEGIEFAKAMTGGSEHLVASLVTKDAPDHMKLRKLTQQWFMPKNLADLEAELGALAHKTVDRLLDAGTQADFVPLVSAPYPLARGDADHGRSRRGRAAHVDAHPAAFRRSG